MLNSRWESEYYLRQSISLPHLNTSVLLHVFCHTSTQVSCYMYSATPQHKCPVTSVLLQVSCYMYSATPQHKCPVTCILPHLNTSVLLHVFCHTSTQVSCYMYSATPQHKCPVTCILPHLNTSVLLHVFCHTSTQVSCYKCPVTSVLLQVSCYMYSACATVILS